MCAGSHGNCTGFNICPCLHLGHAGELTFDALYFTGILDLLMFDQVGFTAKYREKLFDSTVAVRGEKRKSDCHLESQLFVFESSLSVGSSYKTHLFQDTVRILNALVCARQDPTARQSGRAISVGLQFGRRGDQISMIVTLLHPVDNVLAYWSTDTVLPKLPATDSRKLAALDFLQLSFHLGKFLRRHCFGTGAQHQEEKIDAASETVAGDPPPRASTPDNAAASIDVEKVYPTPSTKPKAKPSSGGKSEDSSLKMCWLPAPVRPGALPLLEARDLTHLKTEFFDGSLPLLDASRQNIVYRCRLARHLHHLNSASDQALVLKLCEHPGERTEVDALVRLRGVPGVLQATHLVCVGGDRWGFLAPHLDDVDWGAVRSSADSFFRFLWAVVQAVHACHARNLAHGDLKPSAILVHGSVPTLIDFDLALSATRHMGEELHGTPGFVFGDSPCRRGAAMDCVALGNLIGWVLFPAEGFGTCEEYDWSSHFTAQQRAQEIAMGRSNVAPAKLWRVPFMHLAFSLMSSCDEPLMRTWTLWECEVHKRALVSSPDAPKVALGVLDKKQDSQNLADSIKEECDRPMVTDLRKGITLPQNAPARLPLASLSLNGVRNDVQVTNGRWGDNDRV